MVDVKSPMCPCGKRATFAAPDSKKPTHCRQCKFAGMVDVVHPRCPALSPCGAEEGLPCGEGSAEVTGRGGRGRGRKRALVAADADGCANGDASADADLAPDGATATFAETPRAPLAPTGRKRWAKDVPPPPKPSWGTLLRRPNRARSGEEVLDSDSDIELIGLTQALPFPVAVLPTEAREEINLRPGGSPSGEGSAGVTTPRGRGGRRKKTSPGIQA